MPRYEYRCEANARTLEVTHGMSETLTTWAQLRAAADLPADGTPDDAPVERLISLSFVSGGSASSNGSGGAHTCGRPNCCRAQH